MGFLYQIGEFPTTFFDCRQTTSVQLDPVIGATGPPSRHRHLATIETLSATVRQPLPQRQVPLVWESRPWTRQQLACVLAFDKRRLHPLTPGPNL